VLEREQRSDLKLSLGMLGNSLKAREKSWRLLQEFHMVSSLVQSFREAKY
jgi:hypothetical protein